MKWLTAEDFSKVYEMLMPSRRRIMISSKRNLKMVCPPRPVNGQAINHRYQRIWTDGRLRPQMGGLP